MNQLSIQVYSILAEKPDHGATMAGNFGYQIKKFTLETLLVYLPFKPPLHTAQLYCYTE